MTRSKNTVILFLFLSKLFETSLITSYIAFDVHLSSWTLFWCSFNMLLFLKTSISLNTFFYNYTKIFYRIFKSIIWEIIVISCFLDMSSYWVFQLFQNFPLVKLRIIIWTGGCTLDPDTYHEKEVDYNSGWKNRNIYFSINFIEQNDLLMIYSVQWKKLKNLYIRV